MVPFSNIVLLLVYSSLIHALPSPSTHSLHEKRTTQKIKHHERRRVEETAILPVQIGLAQQGLEQGDDWLMDVSHPESSNFGKFWTVEEVNSAFAPAADATRLVVDWLKDHGITADQLSQSHNQGWIAFNGTSREVESLLHAEFYEHDDAETGKTLIACDEYYLPHHITKHVDYIKPGVMPVKVRKSSVPMPKRALPRSRTGPRRMPFSHPAPPDPSYWKWPHNGHNGLSADLVNCSTWITPPCVYALYSIPAVSGPVSKNNSLGIFEEGDYYDQQDLDSWFATFSNIPNGTHPIPALIDGAVAPVAVEDAGGESLLDLTTAYSLIYPQTITLYQTDDPMYAEEALNGTITGFFDTFLDGIDGSFCTYSAYNQNGDSSLDPVYPDPQAGGYNGPRQCGTYKPTNVISVSYLFGEGSLPVNYQKRQCNEWMKLALQGHTILFASGDYGVASFPDEQSPNGTCLGSNNQIFQPEGPSTCPYVTSVGATTIPDNGTVYSPETAAYRLFGDGSLFTSSGGFSNIFPIPKYQQSAVAQYFKVQNPPYPYYSILDAENIGADGGIYNRIGRGFPDISAVGAWWLDFIGGDEGGYGGTSMSAPIVASMVNRIIEERLKIGKGPIGFLNPHIYAHSQLTTDITSGKNFGCGTDGFMTAAGWDPVTGVGTPNYPRMLQYFLSLP